MQYNSLCVVKISEFPRSYPEFYVFEHHTNQAIKIGIIKLSFNSIIQRGFFINILDVKIHSALTIFYYKYVRGLW